MRPPHLGRPERGSASGSEGVWGERGAEKERRALLTLLRAGGFGEGDVVEESFMRLKRHF